METDRFTNGITEPTKQENNGRKCFVIGLLVGLVIGAAVLCGIYFGVPKTIAGYPTQVPPTNSPLNYKEYDKTAVAADASECSKIATDMLRKGGHAVDAAIAGMLCAGIINCHSAGIGGGEFMTVYDAPSDSVVFINAREVAPIASNKDMFQGNPDLSKLGSLSVGVPGEIAGYWEAHQRFGKLEWSDLFEPSIKIAAEGLTVGMALSKIIHFRENVIRNESFNLGPIFINANGSLKTEGDKIVFPQLAATLRKIASGGANEFYNGSLAQQIVDDLNDGVGDSIITLEDLSSYQPEVREALQIDLHDKFTMFSPPPTSSGAVLSLILNILERYNFTPDSLANNEVLTYHRIIEAFKFAFAKRSELGDDAFGGDIRKLVNKMTSEELADDIFTNITDDKTHDIPYYGAEFSEPPDDSGTSHISVLGEDGSAVSMTSTINTYFGSKVRGLRTGIIFNNEMDDFSSPNIVNFFGVPPSPTNFIQPRKRPLSSMTPIILLNKEENDVTKKVKMISGAAGGTKIITATALSIINHLWFGKGLNESISMLRIHHQLAPNKVQYENGFNQVVVDGLVEKGHEVKSFNPPGSNVQAISRLSNGNIAAVSDERKKGAPDGY